MRLFRGFAASLFAVSLTACVLPAVAGLADRHVERGQKCEVCHLEGNPSADNANEQPCIQCHTESPNGKPVTMDGHKVENVHTGHFDVYECLQCHKGHQPSVSACSECHKTQLSVP